MAGRLISENFYLPVNPVIAGLDLNQTPADLHNSIGQTVVHKRPQFFFLKIHQNPELGPAAFNQAKILLTNPFGLDPDVVNLTQDLFQ